MPRPSPILARNNFGSNEDRCFVAMPWPCALILRRFGGEGNRLLDLAETLRRRLCLCMHPTIGWGRSARKMGSLKAQEGIHVSNIAQKCMEPESSGEPTCRHASYFLRRFLPKAAANSFFFM